MDSHVEIERLVLRVFDLTHDEAARLARDVAEALSERLRVNGIVRSVDLARVKISIPAEVPRARLATAIADRIWEAFP